MFKTSILTLVVVAMANAAAREPRLINPADPLFPHSYAKQAEIQAIQDDIDSIIADVQWGFFSEVQNSSAELLSQFGIFADKINTMHAPVLADFTALPPSSCRDGAETLLNTTRTQTGFQAGNCANRVNNAITVILEKIDKLFENFNRQFSEIQQIVVKSYIKSNLFVDMPDEVITKMDRFFNNVDARWKEQKPEFSKLRNQLRADLTAEHGKLATCTKDVVTFAETMFGLTLGQIDACKEYTQSQRAGARASASRNFIEEAMSYMNSAQFRFSQVDNE